jgi:hypothetical protein
LIEVNEDSKNPKVDKSQIIKAVKTESPGQKKFMRIREVPIRVAPILELLGDLREFGKNRREKSRMKKIMAVET